MNAVEQSASRQRGGTRCNLVGDVAITTTPRGRGRSRRLLLLVLLVVVVVVGNKRCWRGCVSRSVNSACMVDNSPPTTTTFV